jgi:hypothetical protein
MGTLTPGATYVYERSEGIIYAREVGADPGTRRVVGYEKATDYDPVSGHKIDTVFGMDSRRVAEQVSMLQAAETNPALQDALDRAIIIYQLSKINE